MRITAQYNKGFTLAEVLIALALLGVIAAFAIPKVMESVGETQKKALMREAVGELSKVIAEWYLNNDYPKTGEEMDARMQQKLNLLSTDPPIITEEDSLTNYYYTLKNGVGIRMKGNYRMPQFSADYNGFDEGPNKLGEDTIVFWGNLRGEYHCGINPGGIGPYDPVLCPTNQFGSSMQPFYDAFQKFIVN